jgi:predicted nucleic acid-binding protein
VILDAGALIAVARGERAMIARLLVARDEDERLATHPMVVAQVWRDDRGRQATLARFLRSVTVIPLDDALGRRCGELLAKAGTSDPIGAAVVLLARDGETIVTSDPGDLRHLARAAKRRVLIVAT